LAQTRNDIMTNARTKNRLTLILIALVFFVPLALAFLFNAEGWRPAQTRNHGSLIEPARDVTAVPLTLADGGAFAWKIPTWPWTLVLLPGGNCADACRTRIDELLRMRITLGRNAERVRVLYLGPDLGTDWVGARKPLLAGQTQDAAFDALRPGTDDTLALALVDPNGLLMMQYKPGYVASDVREDLVRVLH